MLALVGLSLAAGAQDAAKHAARHTVVGQIVSEHGKPIESAAVWLADRGEPYDVAQMLRDATVRSGVDGRVAIAMDGEQSMQQVVVAARGRQVSVVWMYVAFRGPAEDRVADLGQVVLPPGAGLIGRVEDAEGKPMAGVQVSATSAILSPNAAAQSVQSYGNSDKRGIFRVPCVPRTGLRLTISKLGYVPQVRLVTHESPLSITMHSAPIVRGRLVEADGTPLTDATVGLQTEQASSVAYESQPCAEDGSFALTAPLPPTRYRIHASRSSKPEARLLSKLLRGAQRGVSLDDFVDPTSTWPRVVVQVVDAKTGKRIPEFLAAVSHSGVSNLQSAMYMADHAFRSYQNQAVVPIANVAGAAILVTASGYAFGAELVPENLDNPMVIRLGPEAVVRGRVLDEQGKPVVGAAVRALPDSSARQSGRGGDVHARWPRTDAQGNYRIGGLRAGVYQVQAYPSDRPGSAPRKTTVSTEPVTQLDLKVSSRREVTLELKGALPEGPAPIARLRFQQKSRRNQGYLISIPPPAPVVLRRGIRSFAAGVQQGDRASIEVFLPSRTRVGSGAVIPFEQRKVVDGKVTLELPKLEMTILRGRIEVAGRLPTARIAIVATPDDANKNRRVFGARKVHAGVYADGSFAIDVPVGSYALQLVDVETQIVFHTEEQDVDAGTVEDLVLRPKLRWLEVNLECQDPQQPAMVRSFKVQLERPRGGASDAFAGRSQSDDGLDQRGVLPITLAPKMRWLVPTGPIEVIAQQSLRVLDRHIGRYYFKEVATAALEIAADDEVEASVTLTVPAPLPDAELERPHK